MTQQDPLGDLVKPGEVVAGKYRIDRVLGRGGMGVVVEAWHLHFEERVAVKFLLPERVKDEESMARFEREAKAAYRIKSEHAARVLDVGRTENNVPYIAMEFLEGKDLGQLIMQQPGLSIDEAVHYVLQAAEAVAEAHSQGIVHRDLKPENLYIIRRAGGTSCIKVLDFGLSKLDPTEAGAERTPKLTQEEVAMGTPTYMAPEQWMGAANAEPASDQWALGCILYELILGKPPFEQAALPALFGQIVGSPPPSMRNRKAEVPAELEAVIFRSLEKEAANRYPSVADFAVALAPFAPRRARETIRRITEIMHAAGMASGQAVLPPSEMPAAPAGPPNANGGAVAETLGSAKGITSLEGDNPDAETAPTRTMVDVAARGSVGNSDPSSAGSVSAMQFAAVAQKPSNSNAGRMLLLVVGALVLGGALVAAGVFLGGSGEQLTPAASQPTSDRATVGQSHTSASVAAPSSTVGTVTASQGAEGGGPVADSVTASSTTPKAPPIRTKAAQVPTKPSVAVPTTTASPKASSTRSSYGGMWQ